MGRSAAILCCAAALAVAPPLPADDWPQWRGPARDGRSAERGLLESWPAGGPPLLWRAVGFGSGYSSVAVAGGKVFTLGDVGEDQFLIAASDLDGSLLWKQRVGPAWSEAMFGGSRSTPTVDGGRVYALGTDGDLLCADAETGEALWRRDLVEEFAGKMMFAGGRYDWRFSESPLVDGDRVVVSPGARDAALVALDKKTGEPIWRAAIPPLGEQGLDGAAYASAVVSQGAGVRQYVQLLGRGLVGIDAATGRFLWGYNRIANSVANIPTPIVTGDFVFASSGYGAGAVLLKLDKREDGVRAREVYFLDGATLQNHHGGLVLDDGYVYGGTGLNKGFPLCIELATGKVAWGPIRNLGRNSVAVIYADERLYLRYQSGLMLLVEATPAGYREHGSFTIPDVQKESWSHPVVANGRLYLREQDQILVYAIRR
ncbi:MAG TPA: PQQ-binding-like beta-propeller repeat protein [Candidatus Polarisedimenticolaceae bacterium]|nr:PQQ-binding-like beta-propeller repeat protein [Candidatus Polarisedimenticolaceae bacterium]